VFYRSSSSPYFCRLCLLSLAPIFYAISGASVVLELTFPLPSTERPSNSRYLPSMSSTAQSQQGNLDRYVVIHVATTCDEHGVYVTKDSAEVIELGWILLDAKSCEEVRFETLLQLPPSSQIADSAPAATP
jgi:hypothetical protein